MFSYYERMLAVVPRWSIAPRINQQSVAEHSFYVALYTDKLTRILGWEPDRRYEAVSIALRHDMVEAQTGDTPGPVKRQIVDRQKLFSFQTRFFAILGRDYDFDAGDGEGMRDDIRVVIKAADLIDELFWISMETMMGNTLLIYQRSKVIGRLSKALNLLGLYDLTMQLQDECAKMARGIDLPENNEDLR